MFSFKRFSSLYSVSLFALLGVFLGAVPSAQAAVALKPPMGWNSYDAFNFSVTEAEFKANVDTMAAKYLSLGWEYAVVDWCWSFPGMGTQATPNQGWTATGGVTTRIKMDAYGRPQPDTVRHPSSVGGKGFKPLADYAHSKGLKFGIHLMRGVYRQAYWDNLPILGTTYTARQIADTTDKCPWLDHAYGLNMSHPGAQAYLNSLFKMFAEWGVDFIKIDDMVQNRVTPFTYHTDELAGYRKAIDSSGREMVFSSSPGATPLTAAAAIAPSLNQWRMADDLWDNWTTLSSMIDLARQWYPWIGNGHWPDADMIPIGRVSKRGPNGSTRYSSLTRTEQYTMMSMWAMCRSPLIWGGNPAENRPAEDSLMTNATVIAINQNSSRNRYIGNNTNLPVWAADSPIPQVKYFAFFNRTGSAATMSISLDSLGAVSGTPIDVWTGTSNGSVTGTFSTSVPSHGSALYRFVISEAVAVRRAPAPAAAPEGLTGEAPFGIYEIRGRKVEASKVNAAGVYLKGVEKR